MFKKGEELIYQLSEHHISYGCCISNTNENYRSREHKIRQLIKINRKVETAV